jgi:hypothetical protein
VAALAVGAVAGAGCVETARNVYGTLPGEAHGALSLTEASVKAKTVATDGSPSERTGLLTTVRYSVGAYFTFTRFGAMSGIEGTAALGWLTGDATRLDGTSEARNLYIDNEIGGAVQPFPILAAVRLTGDFGVGYTRDDRYTYAGGRLAIAPASRKIMLDLGIRRHFGDTPGNAGAHEDRFRAWISIRRKNRRSTIHLGFDYIRGDQRTLVNGMEMGADDYLLRGKYQMFAFTLGFGSAAAKPEMEGVTSSSSDDDSSSSDDDSDGT